MQLPAQVRVVGGGHVREPGSRFQVGPGERIAAHEVDVVGEHHQLAHPEPGVDGPGGVGVHHGPDPQAPVEPHGPGDQGHGVAFVAVEPAGLEHHPAPLQFAKDQPARVPRHRLRREAQLGEVQVEAGGGFGAGGQGQFRHERRPFPDPGQGGAQVRRQVTGG